MNAKDKPNDIDYVDLTIDIATSTTLSTSTPIGRGSVVGLYMPAGFDGTDIDIQASNNEVDFKNMHQNDGVLISKVVAAGTYSPLNPVEFIGAQYVRIKTQTVQTADRSFKLAIRRVV